MIKHIFSDMDGTLLNQQGIVSDTTAAAIRTAGIPLTLVSARAPMEMAAAIDKLGLTGPQIGFNGGLIYRRVGGTWETISARTIDTELAGRIVRAIRTHFPTVSVSLYDRDNWYADEDNAALRHEMQLTMQTPTFQPVDVTLAKADLRVFKIMMMTFEDGMMARLNAFFATAGWTGITVQQSGTSYLEITSREAKKSRGIQFILDEENLEAKETAAFGDGHNDLPMLEMVGMPVVMANALPEIKAVAAAVTKSNVDDGIAHALQNFAAFGAPAR